jgi:hypothetical protein
MKCPGNFRGGPPRQALPEIICRKTGKTDNICKILTSEEIFFNSYSSFEIFINKYMAKITHKKINEFQIRS